MTNISLCIGKGILGETFQVEVCGNALWDIGKADVGNMAAYVYFSLQHHLTSGQAPWRVSSQEENRNFIEFCYVPGSRTIKR